MRQHKFRVWNKKDKFPDGGKDLFRMHYDSQFILTAGGGLQLLKGSWDTTWEWLRLDPHDFVVMFSTGLKDKNGKEIYEGDIVREIYYNDEVVPDSFVKWIIKWNENSHGFNVEGYLVPTKYLLIKQTETHYYEVVGNIYEDD